MVEIEIYILFKSFNECDNILLLEGSQHLDFS